jgi:hypothetical protein
MPEEYTFLLYKSYSRESRTDFPGKREWQNHRDPGKSGTGNPGNETLAVTPLKAFPLLLGHDATMEGDSSSKGQDAAASAAAGGGGADSSLSTKAPKEKLTSTRKFFGADEDVYIMDAKSIGNIGRYLNHSCRPNVFVQGREESLKKC